MATFSLEAHHLEKLQLGLQRLPLLLQKDTRVVLRDEAGLLAKEIAKETPPGSAGQGRKAVRRDIGRVYLRPWQIRNFIQKTNPDAAKAFWKAVSTRNIPEATAIIRRIDPHRELNNPVLAPDPAIHARARDRRGRVSPNYRARSIVIDEKALRAYIEHKASHVGLTKSPWAKIADALGKRVQPWQTGQASNPIFVDDTQRMDGPSVTIGSNIPWASEFKPQAERALNSRQEKIRLRIEHLTEWRLRTQGFL